LAVCLVSPNKFEHLFHRGDGCGRFNARQSTNIFQDLFPHPESSPQGTGIKSAYLVVFNRVHLPWGDDYRRIFSDKFFLGELGVAKH
jgi:hypothetical protein